MRLRVTILVGVLMVFAAFCLVRAERTAVAQPATPPQAAPGCTVPRNWGSVKAAYSVQLFFEDSSGTVRRLDQDACSRGTTKVELQIHRN